MHYTIKDFDAKELMYNGPLKVFGDNLKILQKNQ